MEPPPAGAGELQVAGFRSKNTADIFCMLTHGDFEVKFLSGSAKVTGGPLRLQI